MSERPTLRAAPLLGGVALLAIYVRIGARLGFQATYGPPLPPLKQEGPTSFTFVGTGEHRFWLAHLVLAIPASLLIAWGLAPRLGPQLARLARAIDRASTRAWRIAGVALFVGLFAYSAVGRHAVLHDRPITDDENAVTFGARMIAEGQLSVPALEPAGAYTDLFTYQRDGRVSAMDFPGVLGFAALGIVLGVGGLVYAFASAVAGVAVAYAAGRWLGPRARALAAAIWIASPMISSLSLTSHGHVPSRMFAALALAFAARLDTTTTATTAGSPRRDAALLGLFAGLGFLCRPFEIACLLAPLGLYFGWRIARRQLPRACGAWLVAGMVPAIAAFAWYNAQTTGVWYLQARFAPGVVGGTPSTTFTWWDRAAFNLGFDLLMLAVFFLGVPAIAAIIGGLDRKRAAIIALAVGVAANFALCLGHDNTGVHMVGPIHFSDLTPSLVVITVAGIVRGFAWLAARDLPRAPAATLLAGYLVLACGAFAVTNMVSLQKQAESQQMPDDLLDGLDIHHAVVISPRFIILPQIDHTFAPWGTWMLEFPHPDPYFRDDRIFARYPDATPAAMHARFPDRKIVDMRFTHDLPSIRISEVEFSQ